jgi:hypothetical protein
MFHLTHELLSDPIVLRKVLPKMLNETRDLLESDYTYYKTKEPRDWQTFTGVDTDDPFGITIVMVKAVAPKPPDLPAIGHGLFLG